MPPTPFIIKLGEGQNRVSIETLAQALENALDLLRNVGQDFTPAGADVRWEVVGASLRSPLTLKFAPRVQGAPPHSGGIGNRITNACLNGLDQLEKRPELPDHFNEDAMRAAKNLINVAQKDGAKVTVGVGRKHEITPTERAVKHIDQVVEKARVYTDDGTIEGQLEEISVHGGPRIAVWDELTNLKIDCLIGEDQLSEAKDLLGKRVAVSGRVRYRNHRPATIQVQEIRLLRGMGEILRLKDIPPIDITGGLSSEEYVRRMRDAQ